MHAAVRYVGACKWGLRAQSRALCLSIPTGSEEPPAITLNLAKSPGAGGEKGRIPITIREEDIEEKFVRGTGPGGQAVARTSNKVQLLYKPLGLQITCHEQRSLAQNRKIARKKLLEELDAIYNKEESKKFKRVEKLKKQKSKAQKRAKLKYGSSNGEHETQQTDNNS